ncbi:hypothetical protein BJY00DRAFT_287541 [Aspergillus carlsbadensis]|nr:hypothetical protein BJY00DRAFT_287541 [Aspergillus carlsbadensis]
MPALHAASDELDNHEDPVQPPPTMTTVSVAIYNPTDSRDPSHWALWLRSADNKSVILQVGDDKGGRGYYVDKPVYKEPMRSLRLAEAVHCGTIATDDHDQAVALIQAHPVDNESKTWNCQAWVMENLAQLVGVGVLVLAEGALEVLTGLRQEWQ